MLVWCFRGLICIMICVFWWMLLIFVWWWCLWWLLIDWCWVFFFFIVCWICVFIWGRLFCLVVRLILVKVWLMWCCVRFGKSLVLIWFKCGWLVKVIFIVLVWVMRLFWWLVWFCLILLLILICRKWCSGLRCCLSFCLILLISSRVGLSGRVRCICIGVFFGKGMIFGGWLLVFWLIFCGDCVGMVEMLFFVFWM